MKSKTLPAIAILIVLGSVGAGCFIQQRPADSTPAAATPAQPAATTAAPAGTTPAATATATATTTATATATATAAPAGTPGPKVLSKPKAGATDAGTD